MEFLLAGVAACGACLFTNPLEVVKTRMQLQGELQRRGSYQLHYRNVFHATYTIWKVDGWPALQKGLLPALVYQFCMNGIRLGTYSIIEDSGYTSTRDGRISGLRSTVSGALAGVTGAILSSPIYLVKTHLQAQSTSTIAVGHQYKHERLGLIFPETAKNGYVFLGERFTAVNGYLEPSGCVKFLTDVIL
ncbi:solute carrier family 25 member 35-like [Rhincodon typus]|uniref:solute carrier family 25 member 35-like n=1 Tax=Rhincodon typus TaxID=259920 RepID=UPI00202F0DCA|nr:solute carrier family 25 member 35-like [Rhincodon typus]